MVQFKKNIQSFVFHLEVVFKYKFHKNVSFSLIFYLFKTSRSRTEISALKMALKQLLLHLPDVTTFAGCIRFL